MDFRVQDPNRQVGSWGGVDKFVHLRFAERRFGFGLTGQSNLTRPEQMGMTKDFGSSHLHCRRPKNLTGMGFRLWETW